MPQTLTAEEANQLASQYNGIADALGKFRSDNWTRLTEAQREQLRIARNDIRDEVPELVKLALKLTLDDLSGTLARIKQATNGMKTAITHLKNVDKAIKIATSLVTLAGALASANPAPIADAIAGVLNAGSDEQGAANN